MMKVTIDVDVADVPVYLDVFRQLRQHCVGTPCRCACGVLARHGSRIAAKSVLILAVDSLRGEDVACPRHIACFSTQSEVSQCARLFKRRTNGLRYFLSVYIQYVHSSLILIIRSIRAIRVRSHFLCLNKSL